MTSAPELVTRHALAATSMRETIERLLDRLAAHDAAPRRDRIGPGYDYPGWHDRRSH